MKTRCAFLALLLCIGRGDRPSYSPRFGRSLFMMRSRVKILLTRPWLALFALCAVVQGAEYEFQWAEGDSLAPVPDGVVWLYHYGWGSLQRHKLADIREGKARIELTARALEEEVQPASNTQAFVLVLEFPAKQWYRTADIGPTNFLRDCLPALDSIGTVNKTGGRTVTKLVLPKPVESRIRFLSPEGVPLARKEIPVSIYVSNRNHCAIHEGLPLGTFETDDEGWLVVRALPWPLYMGLSYWVPIGPGFADQMFASQHGMIVDPSAEEIRLHWSLPRKRWELHLRNQEGEPVAKASLIEWERITGCGANWGPLGITDEEGFVRVTLRPQTVERLAFENSTRAQRDLSAEELALLWREKKLTVIWPGERQ